MTAKQIEKKYEDLHEELNEYLKNNKNARLMSLYQTIRNSAALVATHINENARKLQIKK